MRIFNPFNVYYSNYNTAVKLLTNLETKKQVQAFVQKLMSKCNMTLAQLLIVPVQRIPRYRLLMQELIKYTDPKHPDYSKLEGEIWL